MEPEASRTARPGGVLPGPIERAHVLVRIVLAVVIIELTAATANIHFDLGGPLFTLNGVGYVVLGAAYAVAALVPFSIVQRFAWLPRIALAGYTLVTIGGYLVMGPYLPLGWTTKGIELSIFGLLVADLVFVYGSPKDAWRAAVARLPNVKEGRNVAPTHSGRVPLRVRLFSPILKFLLVAGIPLGPNRLVTVRGRKTGRPRTAGIAVIEVGDRRWVWAPWGEVNWVRNLRAAGRATIAQRGGNEEVAATELDPEQRVGFFRDVLGPLARSIPGGVWFIRIVDGVDINDPVTAADGRCVFELRPIG
jgi:deazaflavin-dependent oxidoreductase (nitroreductase family)